MLTRILIVVAALICAIAGVASRAQAQLAPPTLPADEVYAPVVYVLSGPAQATDGDTVAFRLDYRPFTPPAGVPTGGGGAVFAYSIGPSLARAAEPAPPTFVYKIVVRGPASSHPGERVTYDIAYTLNDSTYRAGLGLTFSWPDAAASFVSAGAVAGPPGVLVHNGLSGGRDSFRRDLTADGTGTLGVALDVRGDFAGQLTAGVDIAGTNIFLPQGSATSVTTDIKAVTAQQPPPTVPGRSELALPSTGAAPARAHAPRASALTFVLAMAVAGVTVLVRGATMRPRR
jgi:hypothetical protein